VIKSGIKLDHWCRDELYDTYVSELIKIEPADGAIQRSIKTMMDWANVNNAQWEHYFAYVNLNRATHDIKEGTFVFYMVSMFIIISVIAGHVIYSATLAPFIALIALSSSKHCPFTRPPADTSLLR
jgi:hypothetical protein